jgi:hypothetical protein
MPISAKKIKGKFKRDIAREAFKKLGPNATVIQIDAYFKKNYKLPFCERSMYWRYKREAQGIPLAPLRRYPKTAKKMYKANDLPDLIARIKHLAHDVGGWDKLTDLIQVLQEH